MWISLRLRRASTSKVEWLHLVITPENCSRKKSKVLTAKSMAKLLSKRSNTALWYQVCRVWPSSTSTGRFRVSDSCYWQHSTGVAKQCLNFSAVTLLAQSEGQKDLMLGQWTWKLLFLIGVKMKFTWIWWEHVTYQSRTHQSAQSFGHSMVFA